MGVVEPLRERLVSAGVDMLEEVGAAQLGLRQIARETGVSHGAPRRYFPTHNTLLAAIAVRGYADLRTRIDAAQDTGRTAEAPGTAVRRCTETIAAQRITVREQVERMGLAYVEFAAERPEMFTLMFRHDLLEGAGGNLRVTTTLPMFARWRELIAECAPDRAGARALNLWTNLHGIAVVVANRSIEAVAPGTDVRALVADAVARHLAADPAGQGV
ncbi:TetR/AcrR family transcriptional regulator [Nocardia crassostreae]|uniref:TetR/AcrR family transcriptional regulator n=1 Tax=Nocardia crassostreae TaxID=53428 RepID=UPI0008301044|nr:TetR/AcrR family transcriptional regulator [Nocardia crassostreae]